MKNELIALALFFSMCGLFVFNSCAVNKCSEDIVSEIRCLKASIDSGNTEEIERCAQRMGKKWRRQTDKILYICHHNQIEEIDRTIFSAKYYVKEKNYEKAKYKLSAAEFLLSDLSEREKLRLDNIF